MSKRTTFSLSIGFRAIEESQGRVSRIDIINQEVCSVNSSTVSNKWSGSPKPVVVIRRFCDQMGFPGARYFTGDKCSFILGDNAVLVVAQQPSMANKKG